MVTPSLNTCVVPRFPKQLGKSDNVRRQGRGKPGRPDVNGVSAGHQGGPGRHALRRAYIHAGEPDTVLGNGIDVGRMQIRVSVTAEVRCAMIIAQYEQDIWKLAPAVLAKIGRAHV